MATRKDTGLWEALTVRIEAFVKCYLITDIGLRVLYTHLSNLSHFSKPYRQSHDCSPRIYTVFAFPLRYGATWLP